MNHTYSKQITKYRHSVTNRKSETWVWSLVLPLFFIQTFAFAQDTNTEKDAGPSIMVGTQIPLQYSIGINYHFSPVISARAQFGLLTKPYDRMVLAIMEQFGLEKSINRIIERSLNNGLMYTLGGNYHFGKNYVGIYGQHARLSGNISLEDAASAYFSRDLSFLSPFGVSLLEISAKSNLYNAGLLYGRRFTLSNPKFEILAEAGIAKILGSNNQFSTNQRLLEQVPLVKQLYRNLDSDFASAYRRYGYLPTLNIYLNYHF
jgi:hypothetical protein